MVDLDLLLADLGRREAFFPKRELKRGAGVDHVLCDDRVAGLYGESLTQVRGLLARCLEAGKLHRLEAVLPARIGFEDDLQIACGGLDPGTTAAS